MTKDWPTLQVADMKVDALLDAKAAAENAAHHVEEVIKADDPKAAAQVAVEAKLDAFKGRVKTALTNPGTPADLLKAEVVDKYECIKTPAEVRHAEEGAGVWRRGGRVRRRPLLNTLTRPPPPPLPLPLPSPRRLSTSKPSSTGSCAAWTATYSAALGPGPTRPIPKPGRWRRPPGR